MRTFLKEGDLVSAEVHKILNDGVTVQLHTRSTRYGKLENGCFVTVPPGLIPKRKSHFVSKFIDGRFDILLGCNGWIWMQRAVQATNHPSAQDNTSNSHNDITTTTTEETTASLGGPELAQLQEAQRDQHAQTPYSLQERQQLARLRNTVECLRLTSTPVTLETMQKVYHESIRQTMEPFQMLQHVLPLTQGL
mmetsp:Transcript_21019/g.58192  ORF Transcript_21019/g.58192 Transcript_21019/m.58192 type:complete len:193 (+) Transcript_21019:1532-2110(+)